MITNITPMGVFSTFSTAIGGPRSIAIDSSDSIYVKSDNQVFEFTSSGDVQAVTGIFYNRV